MRHAPPASAGLSRSGARGVRQSWDRRLQPASDLGGAGLAHGVTAGYEWRGYGAPLGRQMWARLVRAPDPAEIEVRPHHRRSVRQIEGDRRSWVRRRRRSSLSSCDRTGRRVRRGMSPVMCSSRCAGPPRLGLARAAIPSAAGLLGVCVGCTAAWAFRG
ncbi:unnamed protein product [Urochloa humidicola]